MEWSYQKCRKVNPVHDIVTIRNLSNFVYSSRRRSLGWNVRHKRLCWFNEHCLNFANYWLELLESIGLYPLVSANGCQSTVVRRLVMEFADRRRTSRRSPNLITIVIGLLTGWRLLTNALTFSGFSLLLSHSYSLTLAILLLFSHSSSHSCHLLLSHFALLASYSC